MKKHILTKLREKQGIVKEPVGLNCAKLGRRYPALVVTHQSRCGGSVVCIGFWIATTSRKAYYYEKEFSIRKTVKCDYDEFVEAFAHGDYSKNLAGEFFEVHFFYEEDTENRFYMPKLKLTIDKIIDPSEIEEFFN